MGRVVTHRGRKLAWQADLPDPRDYSYSKLYRGTDSDAPPAPTLLQRLFPCVFGSKPKPAPSTTEVDLYAANPSLWPAVFDQGDLGSCVANAVVAATAYDLALEGAAVNLRILSRLYNYYYARGGVPDDTGTTIRDAVKALSKQGDCLEATWPYNVARYTDKPSVAADTEAAKKHAITYARLSSLDDIKHCISGGRPVVFGMMLFNDFWDVTASANTLRMPAKSENSEGGHAQQVHGFSEKRGAFRALNSWGESWGDKGRYWLPYEYVTAYASDFWTVRTVPAT